MIILGIETSCDETAAAVVENGTKVLSNIVASSADMHAKTGGIIPEQAARQQISSIIPVIRETLERASETRRGKWEEENKQPRVVNHRFSSKSLFTALLHPRLAGFSQSLNKNIKQNPSSHFLPDTSNIDAIAVTIGPGLIGSLLVGVETAKTLALLWQKPIIPVNHLLAHLYANWLMPEQESKRPACRTGRAGEWKLPEFPAVALVVSGGHTDLVLMKNHPSTSSGQAGNIQWLGGTLDDAAGEAFDKTARLLGLSYPGGPSIAKKAMELPISNYQFPNKLPRPMMNKDNFDFSFSGLKTAVFKEVQKLKSEKKLNHHSISHLAAEIQEAIVDVLVAKTIYAVKKFKPKSLLLAGGVAANTRLREKFQLEIRNSKLEIKHFVPLPSLCTDNATYLASYAFFNFAPLPWQNISTNPQLTISGET